MHAFGELQASETALTAAYLQKIPGFVEWPPGTFKTDASPLLIGVFHADALHDELVGFVKDKLVQKRAIEVVRLDGNALPPGLNVLFLASVIGSDHQKLVEQARRSHVLVITEDPTGLHPGSALNFVNVDRRLRFEVSLAESEREGVKLSSRLLGVAVRVEERAP